MGEKRGKRDAVRKFLRDYSPFGRNREKLGSESLAGPNTPPEHISSSTLASTPDLVQPDVQESQLQPQRTSLVGTGTSSFNSGINSCTGLLPLDAPSPQVQTLVDIPNTYVGVQHDAESSASPGAIENPPNISTIIPQVYSTQVVPTIHVSSELSGPANAPRTPVSLPPSTSAGPGPVTTPSVGQFSNLEQLNTTDRPPLARTEPIEPPHSAPQKAQRNPTSQDNGGSCDGTQDSLPSVWDLTVQLAAKKLQEHGLQWPSPLDPASLNSISATKNIQSLVETLESHRKEAKRKQWNYTFRGKKIVVAQRLEKIFRTVDKYTRVVDTAIQHSPEITALAWAGVRFMLQVRSDFCFPWNFGFWIW